MAKLPTKTTETVLNLKRQLIDIVDEAKATEFVLFTNFGETEDTLPFLDEMKSVAERAVSRFLNYLTSGCVLQKLNLEHLLIC